MATCHASCISQRHFKVNPVRDSRGPLQKVFNFQTRDPFFVFKWNASETHLTNDNKAGSESVLELTANLKGPSIHILRPHSDFLLLLGSSTLKRPNQACSSSPSSSFCLNLLLFAFAQLDASNTETKVLKMLWAKFKPNQHHAIMLKLSKSNHNNNNKFLTDFLIGHLSQARARLASSLRWCRIEQLASAPAGSGGQSRTSTQLARALFNARAFKSFVV